MNLDSHGGIPHADPQAALLQAALNPPPQAVSPPSLPTLDIDAAGWITGPSTKKEPAGIKFGTGWHFGHPIGVLSHFTVGCGDPHDTLVSRGVSAHGCTLQDGTLVQYVSFRNLSFHAYDQAFYTVGWENSAFPGVCDFDTYRLARLAQLNAAVIAWTKKTYGFDIPVARAPGWHYEAGIKCHTDGLEPGSPWDPKRHWDAPWKATGDPIAQWISSGERTALDRSPWSADDFIAAIKTYGGDDVTPEQAKTIADAKAFLDAVRAMGQTGDKTKAATPTGAGQRVAKTVQASEAGTAPGTVPKHSHKGSVSVT